MRAKTCNVPSTLPTGYFDVSNIKEDEQGNLHCGGFEWRTEHSMHACEIELEVEVEEEEEEGSGSSGASVDKKKKVLRLMLHSWVQPGREKEEWSSFNESMDNGAENEDGEEEEEEDIGRGCVGSRRLLMLDYDEDGRQGLATRPLLISTLRTRSSSFSPPDATHVTRVTQ
jgi:hypothetical protein